MKERQLNPTQSLDLIQDMINTAKNKLADDGFLLILWGWLVAVAAMSNYLSLLSGFAYGHYVWAVLMPAGAIISMIYGWKERRKTRQRTYIDTYLAYVWLAFIIGLFITLIFMRVHSPRISYFFLMILYGLATMISGGLLNFKPLLYGSIGSFICAVISVFSGEREILLCISAAILFSYIIPGHLLRARFKSQTDV